MSYTDATHGALLAAFVKSQVPAGESVRAFCLARGLDNSRLTAWEKAENVDVDSMRRVAAGLGMTLGQVLVAAGYAEPDEVGGATPPPPVEPPDVDAAIDGDPNLSDDEREVLRRMRRFMHETRGDDTITVRRNGPKVPKLRKPRPS